MAKVDESPILKVLDFLIDNESFDCSKTDIEKGTGLSKATLLKAWPKLEALDLITVTRTVGQAKMYKLNKQNPVFNRLMVLNDAISEYFDMKHCSSEDCPSNVLSDIADQARI